LTNDIDTHRDAEIQERKCDAVAPGIVVSIVVPFFNESQTLETLVNRVVENPFSKEIILVDDGSTDDSLVIAQRLADKHTACVNGFANRLVVKTHETNIGKGAALKTGLLSVSGDIIVLQDADLEYHPEEILQLIQPIINNQADVVYGSRFINDGSDKNRKHSSGYFSNYIANQLITRFSNLLTGLKLTDIETGYKVFTQEVSQKLAPALVSRSFAIEPEITARVAKQKVRVTEVPISYSSRTYQEGKKIGWWDGIKAVLAILRFAVSA
jgi:glycosyltransferase involved in cell wall biosynthesis|tara:strand:- start:1143 stop:1949 length:807 start_codon:yes stop_codon:yes gene_type:complete